MGYCKIAPQLEYCIKEEFKKFITNYPNKLHVDFFMDAYSWNDFTIAELWPDTMVAMEFPPMYHETESKYKIAVNIDEVFASRADDEE